MNHLVEIKAKNSPEFLERLLRVCRHRGFCVTNINAQTNKIEQTLIISLQVESVRELSLLIKQIEKVVGVLDVTLPNQQEIKASA